MQRRTGDSQSVVVDTDVFSLIIRDDPISPWYARRIETESRYLSFCSFGELLFGIVRLPESRRKADLAERTAAMLDSYEIVEPTAGVAYCWAAIRAECERDGNAIPEQDAWIAACARMLGCAVVTHNAADFRRVRGLDLITMPPPEPSRETEPPL